MLIRRAASGDAPFIERLSAEAFGEYARRAGSGTLAMLARTRAATRVAELDRQRIGFSALAFEQDHAHLLAIAVERPWRGRGFGKQLLDDVIRHAARRVTALELVTADSNLEALHLFLRSGFRVVDRHPGYYGRGQTGLWLRRPLP